ncbi:MAG TPA: cation diffusion facilitator family transporter [Steroidobacteraceae bacterium]|nr:cation diffusion facilitator family transporter [Steroidobacteraceae bacterium]
MSGSHHHHHHHGHHRGPGAHEMRLVWALVLTAGFLLVEIAGGLLTNSLALLSDAAHMATDVAALGVALAALRLARRPADPRRSYGYARLESFGAMVNGAMLIVVAGYVLWEAVGRIRNPTPVAADGMLLVAALGLIVNLVSMRLLQAGSHTSLNLRGAYLEVWSDALGSAAAIIGALLIRFTGWTWVDAVIAVLIGLWILPRTWALLRDAGHILLEAAPAGLDLDEVRKALAGSAGVRDVHDLHVWALGSADVVLTAHVVIDPDADIDQERVRLGQVLAQRFGIRHATLQMEHRPCGRDDLHP